jgi:CRISPR-associated protein Csm3
VRDVLLSKNNEKLRTAKTDMPYTEVKWEATIDRITSAAVPRQNERVPPGAIFSPFELVYSLYDLNGTGFQSDINWLRYIFKAMELLEDDYLGGYGSRGAGKVAFKNMTVMFKSRAYYEGGQIEASVLDENKTVKDLQVENYAGQISEMTAG